jgi:hypothetical protein
MYQPMALVDQAAVAVLAWLKIDDTNSRYKFMGDDTIPVGEEYGGSSSCTDDEVRRGGGTVTAGSVFGVVLRVLI